MTISRTYSKEVATLLSNPDIDVVTSKLNGNYRLALSCLAQTVQNLPFAQSHKTAIKTIFVYVTQMALASLIPYGELNKTMEAMIKYHGSFFKLGLHHDLILKSVVAESHYSRLLFLIKCPRLRGYLEKNPFIQASTFREIAPFCLSTMEFNELYDSFTSGEFSWARISSADSLERVLLQCKDWGYIKGQEELEQVYMERLDNLVEVLAVYPFAHAQGFELLKAYGQSFFENHLLYVEERKGCTSYMTHNVLTRDPLLVMVMPNAQERRTLVKGLLSYEGGMSLDDARVEVVEFIVRGKHIEVNYSILDADEFKLYRRRMKGLNRAIFPKIDYEGLVFYGEHPLPERHMMGVARLLSYRGIEFLRNPLVKNTLLSNLGQAKPDLKRLRIVQCPLVKEAELMAIPSLFPRLDTFILNGALFTRQVFDRYLSLSMTGLMFHACKVECPDNLNPLANLDLLELSYVLIAKEDLRRLITAIDKLRILIVIGTKGFDILDLRKHFPTIERLTLSATIVEKENAFDYLLRMESLKGVVIDGNFKEAATSIQLTILAFNKGIEVVQMGSS